MSSNATPRAQSALTALDAAARSGALIVSPAVYAELCAHPGWSVNDLDRYPSDLGVRVDWQPEEDVCGAQLEMHSPPTRAVGAERRLGGLAD